MTAQPTLWGGVRTTDPESARDGARRAPVLTQRTRILLEAAHLEEFRAGPVWLTADYLHEAFPGSQRSCWSTRLAGMTRGDEPLLECDRERVPVRFVLTDHGRAVAKQLRDER